MLYRSGVARVNHSMSNESKISLKNSGGYGIIFMEKQIELTEGVL